MRYNHGYLKTTEETMIVATDKVLTINSIFICNTSGSNSTYSLWHCPKDEANSDEFALYFENVARSKETEVIETPIVLQPGERLIASAGAASAIVLTLYLAP